MSEQIPGYVREAGQNAAKAAGVAGDVAAGEYTIGDILTRKINEAYAANKDIVEKLDASTQGYYSAPSEARVKFEGIFNPFQRENLVSQYVGNKALPMLSQANILGSRMGGIADIVKSGVSGYQAKSARAQSQAQAAQQNYQNLLGQFQLEQELNAVTTQELEMNGRRILATLDRKGNIVKQVDLGPVKKTGGAGAAPFSLTEIMDLINQVKGGNPTVDPNQFVEEDDTPEVQTYQDPLVKIMEDRNRSSMISGISGINFGGITSGMGAIGPAGY